MINEELGEIDGKTIYRLVEPLWYTDHNGNGIVVPSDFQHDLASVPRIPIIYTAWGDRSHREAVLHDYLYRTDSEPVVTRAEADEHFKMAMISRGSRGIYTIQCGLVSGSAAARRIINIPSLTSLFPPDALVII
jgi:hypothetical protein